VKKEADDSLVVRLLKSQKEKEWEKDEKKRK